MPSQNGIEVEGRIVEAVGEGLFRVELANGHRLLGHVAAGKRELAGEIFAGTKVTVRLSHYDLSTGCITRKEN
jgi:translation initiation factor IF-1